MCRASSTYPETLLFINKKAGLAFNATAAGGRQVTSLRSGASEGEADSAAEQAAASGWWGRLGLFSRHPQADLSKASEPGLEDQKEQQQQQQQQGLIEEQPQASRDEGERQQQRQQVDPPQQFSHTGQPSAREGAGELKPSREAEQRTAAVEAAASSDALAGAAAGGVEQLEGAADALQQ